MLPLFRDLFLIGSAVAIVIIATCRFANMRNLETSRIENQPSVFRWLAPTMALSLILAASGGFGLMYLRITEDTFL
jgi:hypothetical protein